MTEQDREIVDEVRNLPWDFNAGRKLKDLIIIIDRLNKQLTNLMEAGEQIKVFTQHVEPSRSDAEIIAATRLHSDRQCAGDLGVKYLIVGNLRCLAKKLKEVKDGQ